MRKVILPVAFLGSTTLLACSFQMRAGGANNPPNNPPAQQQAANTQPSTSAPAAKPTKPNAAGPVRALGKRPAGQPVGPTPTPTSSSVPTTPPTVPSTVPTAPPAPPSGAPVVSAATLFGSGTVDPASFKGTIYFVDKNTTKIPPLADMKPAGFLFAPELNVNPQAFTGFPGVDPARKEYFAIRYEAPMVITAEADYDFRLVADDAAILRIDNTPILDNDGIKQAPAEKAGPVHLVTGTHLIQVDYMQGGGNVALQLFWKKAGDAADAVFKPNAAAALSAPR